MRMAFGPSERILFSIGVIVWIISAVEAPSMQQAANAGRKSLEPEVQQMAGKDANGRKTPAKASNSTPKPEPAK